MDLKTYIQNREETRPSSSIEINPALLEHFKNQVAVIPPPMKVGDEMTVIDFKGENPQQLQVVCALGEEEVRGDVTPNDIPCDPIVEKKYGKKLQFIYSFARNMMLDALITTLKDKKIVLCGQVETPAVYRGQRAKLLVKKFALVEE